MECPNCHKSGNAFKRIFSKRGTGDTRFCVYCNTEVRVIYNWSKILLLVLAIIAVLVIINLAIQNAGYPGISSGFAGGMAGAVLAIFMRRKPFLIIEPVITNRKKQAKRKK